MGATSGGDHPGNRSTRGRRHGRRAACSRGHISRSSGSRARIQRVMGRVKPILRRSQTSFFLFGATVVLALLVLPIRRTMQEKEM